MNIDSRCLLNLHCIADGGKQSSPGPRGVLPLPGNKVKSNRIEDDVVPPKLALEQKVAPESERFIGKERHEYLLVLEHGIDRSAGCNLSVPL